MIRRSITIAKDVNDKILELRGQYMLNFKTDQHLDYTNVIDCLLRFALSKINKLDPEMINNKALHSFSNVKQ